MKTEARKRFLIDFCYIAVILLLIFLGIKFLIGYLLPFIIAALIAYFMQKPAEYVSRRLCLKKNSIAAIFSALVYFAVGLLAVLLIYRLSVFLVSLTDNLPRLLKKISLFSDGIGNRFSDIFSEGSLFDFELFWQNMLQNIYASVSSILTKSITDIAKATPSFLLSSLVALVASCYIAKDYDRLLKFLNELFGQKISNNLLKIKGILFESVFKLLKSYFILSSITFLEVFIGLSILKVKNTLLIAFLIALVDVLPVLGTGTVLIPWAVLAALSGNMPLGVGLAVLYVLAVVVRNFAEPKIIGTQIGINPLFTLITMFIGLRVLGVIGLFSFPVILIVVIKYYKE